MRASCVMKATQSERLSDTRVLQRLSAGRATQLSSLRLAGNRGLELPPMHLTYAGVPAVLQCLAHAARDAAGPARRDSAEPSGTHAEMARRRGAALRAGFWGRGDGSWIAD